MMAEIVLPVIRGLPALSFVNCMPIAKVFPEFLRSAVIREWNPSVVVVMGSPNYSIGCDSLR